MSLFCTHLCKFNNCGLQFATMYDLIQHIEETHISPDPEFLKKQAEQQPLPSCIPLSYLCRLFPQLPVEKAKPITPEPTVLPAPAYAHKKRASSSASAVSVSNSLTFHHQGLPANRTVTNTGSFISESPTRDEETVNFSDDSFHFSSDIGSAVDDHSNISSSYIKINHSGEEKRYACPAVGCNKRYKNINGVRMHVKTVHGADTPIGRPFKCHICGKQYKTAQGLQNHTSAAHKTVPASFNTPVGSSSTPTVSQGSAGSPRQPVPVTLIAAPPSKGTTTIHVSPAPSPAPGSATMAAAVAGGHQYHQQASYSPYHHQHVVRVGSSSSSSVHGSQNTSGSGGPVAFTVPIVGRSPPVKRYPHLHQGKHQNSRVQDGQPIHGFVLQNQGNVSASASAPSGQNSSGISEVIELKTERS